MKALIDTNVLLWWLEDNPRLGAYREMLMSPQTVALFSAISVAEVSIKSALGKLTVPDSYVDILTADCFEELPFTSPHAQLLRELPLHHKDPFDRMIIAQALVEDLPVMTSDVRFRDYGVRLL